MQTLKEQYTKEIVPNLVKECGVKNALAVPRLEKAVVNVGISATQNDPKLPELVQSVLTRITGQQPVPTRARKSIATFKTREGMVVGYKVTLRGKRMYDFVDKLVRTALPRVRDFRGISVKTVDAGGNLSIGFNEYIAFPEIRADEVDKLHGLEVTLVTNVKNQAHGLALFRALGFPFQKET
jgi:large subunit ribosomal protein L5